MLWRSRTDWYMILPIDENREETLGVARRGSDGGHRGNGAVGQPGLMRVMNLRAAFEIVAAEGPVAATRLVQGTGLSKPTVSEVLRQLLEYGLIARRTHERSGWSERSAVRGQQRIGRRHRGRRRVRMGARGLGRFVRQGHRPRR